MNERCDENLVAAAAAGDRDARAVLVRRHYERVFIVCLGMLGSVHDAEDIAQEAMLKGFTDIRKLRDPRRFGPWLVKIARNLCINLIRRQRCGEKVLAENAQRAIQPQSVAGENDRLEQAIEKLPQEVRLPLVMYYLDGQNVKTVADKLNVSRSGVYQKLRTGIKQLHELLTDQGESSDE